MGRKKKVYKDVQMTGIADKGMAVGRDKEGIVYFVDGAVPGDNADVLVLRKKSSFRKGIVDRFNSYSEERTEPLCDHFGVCGGCKWQNLDYEAQLKYKQKAVLDAFERIAKIRPERFEQIIGCDQLFEYRNKMEYSFSHRRWVTSEEIASGEDIDFGQAVGFHRAGSFDKVVQVDKCHLQDDLSNRIRNFIHKLALERNYSYYNSRDHIGFLRNLRIRNSTLGEWMVLVIFGQDDQEEIQVLMNDIKNAFPELNSLFYVVNTKMNDTINDLDTVLFSGADHITEALGHLRYRIGPKSFFQTNTRQALRLYNLIRELANLKGDELVYDLYTGLGSIALFLAEDCQSVVGIEEIEEAIEDANQNKKLNGIQNAYFEVGDVKDQFNTRFIEKYGKADLVIVDPPRAGLHKDVCDMLNQSGAERIIYVSCNPATQARDITLIDNYKPVYLQAVDMFPHTHHIENVALLERI